MENIGRSASHARGLQLDIHGMFRINGTSDPDNLRDSNSGMIESVTRESAGLFTVLIAEGISTLPDKCNYENAGIQQGVAPTQQVTAHVVVDSFDPTARTFQIQCLDPALGTAADPDDDDTVSFWLRGAIDPIGVDDVT